MPWATCAVISILSFFTRPILSSICFAASIRILTPGVFPSSSNPFSYFTTIAYHAFINRIKKEKKHHEAVTKYKERVYEDFMSNPENTHGHVYVKPPDEENSFED